MTTCSYLPVLRDLLIAIQTQASRDAWAELMRCFEASFNGDHGFDGVDPLATPVEALKLIEDATDQAQQALSLQEVYGVSVQLGQTPTLLFPLVISSWASDDSMESFLFNLSELSCSDLFDQSSASLVKLTKPEYPGLAIHKHSQQGFLIHLFRPAA